MLKEAALYALKTLLPKDQIFTDKTTLVAYEVDAGTDKGRPEGVVFPRSAEEVERVVRWAAHHRVPLVARGAGTGLSGGAVADRGGIIIDFAHMKHILDFDARGKSAVVEPALINLRLDERAQGDNLYFPPDPASQRASTMGGNVAENSGGPHCFKYGVTTNYVIGMDAVLATGQRIRVGGHALDYPGYDLCGLITGSEGTLALITSITLRLLRRPPGVKTMLAIFDSVEQAGNAVSAIIAAGLVPATMELMDNKIIEIIEPFAHAGLPLDAGAVLIIEVDGYPQSLDAQTEEIAQILRQYGVGEMRFAHDEEERARIWLARKSAGGAVARLTPSYYTIDITVPRSRLAEMLTEVDKICKHYDIRAGHLLHAGDGNLHPMLLIPEPEDQELMHRIHSTGHDIVKVAASMNGSLSGEHGVGIEKRDFMSLMYSNEELTAMWDVKQAFDPVGILNPGKVFPSAGKNDTAPFAGYIQPGTAQQFVNDNEITIGDTFTPATIEEAAQGLQAIAQRGKCVSIGNRARTQDVQVCTAALRGIKTYAPDDLYVTVGAGTPLAELQQFLSKDNKQVALASPWSEATVGGIVATNINAPQRMRYGSIRDLVLSSTVAFADGRTLRTGRPIVKNVAGYDLTKAFIGSYGTLGLIADVTLKLSVVPRSKRTLLFPVDDMRHGLIWARQALQLALTASAITLCKGYQERSDYLLVYTAEGLPDDVETELEQVRHTLQNSGAPTPDELQGTSGTDIWTTMLARRESGTLLVRAGLPVADLPVYLQDQAGQVNMGSFIADMNSGLLYAHKQVQDIREMSEWLTMLRQPALERGGYAIVMDAPASLQGLDRWGYQAEGIAVMRALKARWDPQGIMNPALSLL
jgi:D-lactate dehydrogenase (cytochrome)